MIEQPYMEQQQQQQPMRERSDEVLVRRMMNQQQDSSFLIFQLQTDEILEEIEMNLRGYDWSPQANSWVSKRIQIINEEGISVLMTLLKSEVNKTKILSDFDDEEISKIMQEFEINLIDVISAKYREWEVDYNYLTSIRIMLGNAVHATYKRALDGGERKFLKGDVRRVESFSERERSPTLLGGMFTKPKGKW